MNEFSTLNWQDCEREEEVPEKDVSTSIDAHINDDGSFEMHVYAENKDELRDLLIYINDTIHF